MASEEEASAFTVTLKAGGGYDAPWLVVRADTAESLQDKLEVAADAAITSAIGRAKKALETGVRLGSNLGAEAIDEEGAKTVAKEPKKKAAPKRKAPANKAAEPEEEAAEAPEETEGEQEDTEAPEPAEKPRKAPAKAAPKKAPAKAAPKKAPAKKAPVKPAWK